MQSSLIGTKEDTGPAGGRRIEMTYSTASFTKSTPSAIEYAEKVFRETIDLLMQSGVLSVRVEAEANAVAATAGSCEGAAK